MRAPLARALLASLSLLLALAPAMAAAGEGAPKKKERATKDDYELDVSGTTEELKPGEAGRFSLVIRPKNGTKVHPQAPLEVKLKATAGLEVEKPKLSRKEIANPGEPAPELKTGVRAIREGDQAIEADVSFFLCTDEWCQRMTDRVNVPIKVAQEG